MSFQEFLNKVIHAKREHPEWRLGQTYFNVLHDCNPKLANRIRGGAVDPFYKDELVPKFIDFVHERWKKEGLA